LAKSQKRSNREPKKPKREVPKVIAAGQSPLATLSKADQFPGAKKRQ
jgi:hypothetical protein